MREPPPTVADMVAMTQAERLALLARLDTLADAVSEARGALRALLHEPPPPPSLLDAKEAARRLGVSVDTVRAKGTEWGIEVYLGGPVPLRPAEGRDVAPASPAAADRPG